MFVFFFIRIIYVECYGSPEEQSKYFHYKGKPAAHFPLNFQLVGLQENQQKSSIINSPSSKHFNPHTLKTLVNEWHKCKNTKFFASNWQVYFLGLLQYD